MTKKSGFLLLMAAVLCFFSCISSRSTSMRPIQQSTRVDGDLQPKQVKISFFGNHQEIRLTAFSTNFRQFSRELQKGEKTEEAFYWEPIQWNRINNLPFDTKKIKISLVVENPFFKTYRLVKVMDIDGRKREEEVLKFKSGKNESFADIQEFYDIECPVAAGDQGKVIVRLDLLEKTGLAGTNSLTISELSYKIDRPKSVPDKALSKNAEKGGEYRKN